jgi:RNA polymerase sigma-70 factor (ECF subfamily)
MSASALALSPTGPLLPLVAAGDEGAMTQLARRFTPFVRSIGRRIGTAPRSSDDLVQETMLRLWRNADRFDPARGTEPTFVAAVARNVAIDLARREAARPMVPTADVDDLAPAAAEPTERVDAALTVRAALGALTPGQRELVRLAYFEQLSQPEIVDRLDLPLGTVKSRTFHALRALRAHLQEGAPA